MGAALAYQVLAAKLTPDADTPPGPYNGQGAVEIRVEAVKHLQAGLALALLMFSRSYRQRWQRTIDQVDDALDAIAASNRRIEALENGGKPQIRAVDAVSPRCL